MTLSSSFDYRLIDITMSNKNVIKLHRQHFLKECKKNAIKNEKLKKEAKEARERELRAQRRAKDAEESTKLAMLVAKKAVKDANKAKGLITPTRRAKDARVKLKTAIKDQKSELERIQKEFNKNTKDCIKRYNLEIKRLEKILQDNMDMIEHDIKDIRREDGKNINMER